MTLSQYAAKTIGELIKQVARESVNAGKDASADSVHNLRVAIRRLSETLRVFEDVCADDAATAVRKDLRVAMRLAGRIRNHDIAFALAKKADVQVDAQFEHERAQAVEELREVLSRWNSGVIFAIWRTQLHVSQTRRIA